tara:strand:- start:2016 stop:2162 length:147 start_codon:yes stop_codon:yes gene_type:complete
MPQVGDKHFKYNKAGRANARAESAKTGKPVKGYSKGGKVTVKKRKKKR